MSVSLAVAAFTTVEATLAVAQQRNPGAGAAFVDLSPDKQGYAVETAAVGIKALDFSSAALSRSDATWRLTQANIEYALYLAPSFGDDAKKDPLNPEVPSTSNVKRTKTGPLEKEFFAPPVVEAGSLDVFPPVVRSLLAPMLATAATSSVRNYGSGTVRRMW